MGQSCSGDLGMWAALEIKCPVVSKSKGYIDEEIISVQSPCLGLCWCFSWAKQAKGASAGVPYIRARKRMPGLSLQQCRVLPKPPCSPTQIPSSILHPTLLDGALQVADALLQVLLSPSQVTVISWALFPSSLSWFLDFFQLDDVFYSSW